MQTSMDLLRFITCGSVDDGKSTLIGRLLYESKVLHDDQLAKLAIESKRFGTTGDNLDFALLVDGLVAEREQGITIDVAYRFFSTNKRRFIVGDTPGHEQFTRNMATGASTADLAIVMIDARKGVLTQTRRHSFIVSLLGVKHVILAINKMDLVGYHQAIFDDIKSDYQTITHELGFATLHALPISALHGDNITTVSTQMPWYSGPTLIDYLETVTVDNDSAHTALRMPIQWVNRPHADFRGFAGRIAAGALRAGDRIRIVPGGHETVVTRIVTYDGDIETAIAGQSITCVVRDEIEISRGDVFVAATEPCEVACQFEASLLWMCEQPLVAGRQYLCKTGTSTTHCTPSKPKYRIDINSMQPLAAKTLLLNEIGCCDIALDRPIAFEPYAKNRALGSFILIDCMSNATVAAGMLRFALRRSTNIHRQDLWVDKTMRSAIKLQKPAVIWLTGLSGSGKSTIANQVEQALNAMGKHTMLLDGDNIRHGLNQDLGFTEPDRAENIRRVAEVAKLMTEAGLITIVSFISPFTAEREMARRLIGHDQFFEVFVDAPLAVVQERDPKGLYKKAASGNIQHFTGVDSRYEAPSSPVLRLDTVTDNPFESAEKVLGLLRRYHFI